MKISFFWTWNFSKNILKGILEFKDINLCLSVSQPDKFVWRKKILKKTPVKELSEERSIKCMQPKKLKNNLDFFNILQNLNLDFIVVVSYWKIIPKEILKIPKFWCINMHCSILPLYRWASPIQESLKNDDKQTWLTIMYMNENMDEWDILKIEKIKIEKIDKTPDIFEKFEKIWPKLLVNTLQWLIDLEIRPILQNNSLATYCSKISKIDWKIDFYKEKSKQIYNKFRAYFAWPGIYTFYNNKMLIIEDCQIYEQEGKFFNSWQVVKIDKKNIWIVCSDKKILLLKKVKLEWKKSMDILSFINGNKGFIWSNL